MIPTEIYLVASWEQWLAVRDSGCLAPGKAIASYDLDAVVDAGDQGVQAINLFSYQSFEGLKSHEDRAWAFCDTVAEVLKGRLSYQNCDLVDRIKLDLAFPLMYALNAAMVIERCLREHPQARVRIFTQRQVAFIGCPGELPPDLFNAVAWWQAERLGFKPEAVAGPPPSVPPSSPFNWKASDSPLASPEEWVWAGSDDGRVADRASCRTLSVGEFLNMAEQECALAYAVKKKCTDWFVASANPLDALPRIDSRHLWLLPAAAVELGRELAKFKEGGLSLLRARVGAGYDVLLDNPHAAFYWDFVMDLLRRGAMAYAAGRLLAEGLRPKVVLMGNDHLGSTRCLARAFADSGSACVSIQHDGMLAPFCIWPWYKDNPNHLALWSAAMIPFLRLVRPEQSLLTVTGSFRADMHALRQLKPLDPVKGARPRIVLFSNRLGDTFISRASSFRQHQVWLEVVRLCERHPEWDFVVKSHPRYYYQALHSNRACRRLSNLTVVQGKPQDVLAGAWAAILLTELSTVALDAMAADVPVVWLTAAVIDPERHGVEDLGMLEAQTVGGLEDILCRLLEEDSFRSRAVADGRAFLEQALPYTGDEAAAKLCEFVDELTAKASPSQPPEPSARWLIDLMDLLARFQTGQGTLEGFRDRLASLRKRGRKVEVRRLDYLDLSELGGYILQAAVLRPWRREDVDLPALARRIFWSLPRAIRPPLSVLRNYLVHAYVQQGKRTPGWRCKVLPYVLAPGRLKMVMSRRIFPARFSRAVNSVLNNE